jgi:hypothetical protein
LWKYSSQYLSKVGLINVELTAGDISNRASYTNSKRCFPSFKSLSLFCASLSEFSA